MEIVLASAADARYGFHLLNMVGSVQSNWDAFDAIVLFDLGLTEQQHRLAASIDGVDLRPMPNFAPHWRQGFTWKPWVWTHLEAEAVLYLDAGTTVLRSLAGVVEQIDQLGYWLVSQGHAADAILPSSWYESYAFDRALGERHAVAAGIIGFRTSGPFWERVVVPTYEDCLAGRSRGFSAAEVERLNFGLSRDDDPPVRDAQIFRHDQSVLNARLLQSFPDAVVADLDEFAGFRSPRDHPAQVMWSHRRGGDYRYLANARYRRRARLDALVLAVKLRGALWIRGKRYLLQPGVYARKARALLRGAG